MVLAGTQVSEYHRRSIASNGEGNQSEPSHETAVQSPVACAENTTLRGEICCIRCYIGHHDHRASRIGVVAALGAGLWFVAR